MPTISMVTLGVGKRNALIWLIGKGWAHDKLYPSVCLVLSWGLIPTRSVFELASNQGS